MRLWHKDLIPYLPRQQLLGQWRECCLIAKNIAEKRTPNHILVNKIMDYPLVHFMTYTWFVYTDLIIHNYQPDFEKFSKYLDLDVTYLYKKDIFKKWHNDRYLIQCMYNLEEKHDCQGITDDEWNVLLKGYKNITGKDWEND